MKKMILSGLLAGFASIVTAEPVLPNLELVKKYLARHDAAKEKANACNAAQIRKHQDAELFLSGPACLYI